MNKAWIAGTTVFALSIATVIGLPTFVELGRFKSIYLPLIEETLHRRVDFGEVRLSLVPRPSIKLSDLKISAIRRFPAESFFTAQEVQLRLQLWPLLRGRFEITEFVLDNPVFTLKKASKRSSGDTDLREKNPANTGAESNTLGPTPKLPDRAAIALTIPHRLRINDGQLDIVTEGRPPVHIREIELSTEKFSSDRPFPYRASFNYPGLKTVTLAGQLEYQDQLSKLILKDNRLTLQNLTLPLEGSISNLNTGPRFDLVLADDDVDARQVMQILELFGLAPRETEISGPMGLRIAVSGPASNLMTQIQSEFKNVGLYDKRAIKGNLNGAVTLRLGTGGGSEPTKQLQGNGKLSAHEGELTNVDLIRKIQRATGAIGFSEKQRREATTFKTLDTEFTLSNGVVDFSRIYLVNPQLELKGGGTMTLARQALNIGMDATLSPQASGKAIRGRTSQLFKNQRGRLVVPLTVTGNAQNPAVDLDSGKLARRGAPPSMETSLATFFRQLFRR